MLVLIFFSSMWASCIMTQSSHPFGEEIKSYSYLPSFPSGPYLSRGGLFFKTVFTVVTSSLPELSVGSAFVVACVTAGLVFADTCVAVDLMFVDTGVAVGVVFGDTCMAVGLLLVVTCMTIGLVFVETCVTVGLVFVETYVTIGLVFVETCVTVGLVFVKTYVTIGLVFVETCVTVGLVFVETYVTIGLVFVETCVTVGLLFVETYVTVGLVFVVTCMAAGLGAVPSVGFCALLIIQAGQNQTLLLFGILFLPRHGKWQNIPLGQSTSVHFTSLSFLLATVLQVQIEFIFRVSLIMLVDLCFDPPRLNSGKVLHLGQYQVLGIASIPKYDK